MADPLCMIFALVSVSQFTKKSWPGTRQRLFDTFDYESLSGVFPARTDTMLRY